MSVTDYQQGVILQFSVEPGAN